MRMKYKKNRHSLSALFQHNLKNEYPELGGKYEVVHHTEFLKSLLDSGRLTIEGGQFKGKKITFHDPCYLGRANNSL